MGNNVMATGASRSAGIFRALSDRKISTKIALGFACVLTILAIVSGIAYVSLTKTSAAFQAYGQRVAMVGLVREIDRSFLSFRRFVREYALSGEESAAEEAQRQRQLVAKSIDAAQKAIKNPERLAKIKDLASYFEIYAKDFDKLRAMRIEQSKLTSEVMDPTGIKLRAQIEQLHSWAIARANGNNASNLTGDAIKQLMLVRLYANRLLDRRDSAAAQTVDKAFADLKQVMAAVDTTVAGDDFRRVVTDVNTDVEKYAGAFKKAAHDAQMIEILIDGEMSDAAKRISDDAAEIVRSGVAEEQAIEHETENLLLSIEWLLTALAIGGLMLGGILSWVIGRGISRPVQAMTQTMAALANGDLTVDVPAQDKKDEVGEMAKAVLVFRDAAIEKVRMEREVEEERIRSEEARRKAEEEAIGRERSMVSQSIGAGMTKLAAKDLTYRLVDDLPEAYRKLQSDFNFAMDELEKAIAGVRLETDGMKSGTSEIAQASADLSQRTESQAASLEETAAAVEQITATVNKTAEGAGHARQIVLTAKTDAERSGEIVGKAIDAMSAIEKSSRQVSQIIGVIDEIAFQTNLLALNAGVEAARAGDAGRGFAVVASEVRALAQRSADAAKQIKDLISASTVQVDKGVELVGESGKALERIVAGVTEINTVVSEIAAGAEEQATGLKQVNTAVNQMDQVTQQNAAMVEEATAASRTLAQQSDALAEMVSTFRISDIASADPLRNELRKVAPHAFSSPRGHSNSPSRAISNRSLASASRPKQKPMVARASASAAAAATSNDGWDEF